MRETPARLLAWLSGNMGGERRAFCAPIAMDGEDQDAFRRQVGEVGEDPEDLVSNCKLRPLLKTYTTYAHSIDAVTCWLLSRNALERVVSRSGRGVQGRGGRSEVALIASLP